MTGKLNFLPHKYRHGIGIVLINKEKKIFVGKRINNRQNFWQMPQGGLLDGEEEEHALIRELYEETGIKDNIEVIKKSNGYFFYNLPFVLQQKFWNGLFRGQRQRWFLISYRGKNEDVNLAINKPEFSEYKWVDKEFILKNVVGFKKKMYRAIIKEFEEYL